MVVTDDDYKGFHDEPRSVTLFVEHSDVSTPRLEETFRANGSNYEAALYNARNTTYEFHQQDTVIKFDYAVRRRPNMSWHAEEVTLTLKLPLNAKVIIDQKLDNYIQGVNLYECRDLNRRDNKANYSVFTITDNGLQCKVDTGEELIQRMWVTTAASFGNASQNYSQIALAAHMHLSDLLQSKTQALIYKCAEAFMD